MSVGRGGRRRGRRAGRPWWSTWPAAVGLGAVSLAMVAPTSVMLAVTALLSGPGGHVPGTDIEAPGLWIGWRVLYLVLALVFLALPVFACWAARRRLLGFLLWAFVGSALVLGVALYQLRIL